MKKTIIVAVAAALAASSALAAPQHSHSKAGKAFVQVGGGYSMASTKGVGKYNIGKSIKNKGALVEAAVGYHVNDALSVSVNPMIITGLNGKKTVGNVSSKSKLQYMGALVNARYDIATGTMFKPYIMAGVGGMKVRSKDTLGSAAAEKKTKNSFAFQGGAGVAVAVQDNVELELGYRAISTSKRTVKYVKGQDQGRKANVVHNVVAGVRYTF